MNHLSAFFWRFWTESSSSKSVSNGCFLSSISTALAAALIPSANRTFLGFFWSPSSISSESLSNPTKKCDERCIVLEKTITQLPNESWGTSLSYSSSESNISSSSLSSSLRYLEKKRQRYQINAQLVAMKKILTFHLNPTGNSLYHILLF